MTGLILAGGQSRRFGSDKALHQVGGIEMIIRVYEGLATVASPVLISVANHTQRYDLPLTHVYDQFPGHGPLAGLHAGLLTAKTPWVFTTAVDLPFITPSAIQLITKNIADDVDAVVASDGQRLQPLFGCYRRSLVNQIGQLLENNQRSATHFAELLKPSIVELPKTILKNINHKNDLM